MLKSEQYISIYGALKIVSLTSFPFIIFWDSFEGLSVGVRTDTCTEDRQESAVGAVSAVSAYYCETVLDSTGYCCRPPEPLRPLQATVPRGVAAAAGGGRCRSARQEQSACNSSRDKCLHKASGQACCLSARAIRTPEHAGNLLGARGHTACRNPHEIRTQTSRRLH